MVTVFPPSELNDSPPFNRYSRGKNVWYSHKTGDGKWCREK